MRGSSSSTTIMLSVVSLHLAPFGAAAQSGEPTLRSFLEAECGEELAAYEDAVPEGQSVWQGELGQKILDEPNEATKQVAAWVGSAFPLIDTLVFARAKLPPDQRSDVASRLGRAIDLNNCLVPDTVELDAYAEDGPRDALKEIKSLTCIIQRARIVHEAMVSDMGASELRALAKEQMDAADCEELQ
jgi:hypothetical protein